MASPESNGSSKPTLLPRQVALVSGDSMLAERLQIALSADGFSVRSAATLEQLEGAAEAPVVAVDCVLADSDPEELLGQLRARSPGAAAVLLVDDPSAQARGLAPWALIVSKASGERELRRAFTDALALAELLGENARLRAEVREREERLAAQAQSLEAKIRERTALLGRAKDEWETTFDAIEGPIALLDKALRVVRTNRAYAAMAGRPITELPGKLCHELLFGSPRPCAACPLGRGGQARGIELASGPRTFSMSSYETGGRSICIYRETTEERKYLRHALQTEKLAAIGQLAGGVAHEINNPLGGILAFIQLMMRDDGRSEADLETLREIEQASLRCKRIVGSLLKFSRRQPAGRTVFDVNRIADDVTTLFRPQLKAKSRAVFHQEFWPVPLPVNGDVNGVEQVLLSLLVNALQALKDGAGNLSLVTRAQGPWAEIAVSDDGEGIAPENLKHLFEPTFTTRPPGENTGFGLAIAWSIAESHGGTIEVQSELGRGSTFILKMPVAGGPETGAALENKSGA